MRLIHYYGLWNVVLLFSYIRSGLVRNSSTSWSFHHLVYLVSVTFFFLYLCPWDLSVCKTVQGHSVWFGRCSSHEIDQLALYPTSLVLYMISSDHLCQTVVPQLSVITKQDVTGYLGFCLCGEPVGTVDRLQSQQISFIKGNCYHIIRQHREYQSWVINRLCCCFDVFSSAKRDHKKNKKTAFYIWLLYPQRFR